MYKWHRYRVRLVARTLKGFDPVVELGADLRRGVDGAAR